MSFNVTQCPACESTFNTNSRVLAAAAGRVRCGACLNVFEAIDNFLIPEEADTASDQDESVFVGNDPQEFFDPSSFLTRSALSETQVDETGRVDPIDEQDLHQELEQTEAVNADFFATVAEELQGRTGPSTTETQPEDEEQQIAQPEGEQGAIVDESIAKEFEEEILDSFAAEAADAQELTEDEQGNSLPEEAIESAATLADAEQTRKEHTESFLGSGLSASFTFKPHGPPEVRIGKPPPQSTPDEEAASEKLSDLDAASDAETGLDEDEEKLASDAPLQALEKDTQVPYESVSSPIDRTDDSHALARQEEAPAESAAEDEQPTIEAPANDVQDVDEESTEAIRARALETELNDEDALEAIPRENLAALGSMSTPVELLARKESRLLRSTLLLLSILLLGGLLSAQYLWQRMELYSQLPQLRPLYAVACGYLNCTLPEYRDIDSIRSENLTVQTHPTLANGLMVNTVMRNTSAFEQPFPILILSFNSLEDSVIALREFTAAEYLDPGIRSVRKMPALTPVQIGLAIMDPGPEAANYTLAFRWP